MKLLGIRCPLAVIDARRITAVVCSSSIGTAGGTFRDAPLNVPAARAEGVLPTHPGARATNRRGREFRPLRGVRGGSHAEVANARLAW